MTLRRSLAVAVLVAVGAASACSSSPDPAPSPSDSLSVTPAPTLTPPPTPTEAACPSGQYQVTGFTAPSSGGSGSGGDLTATFDPTGTFVLTGGGQQPMQVTVNGRQAEALVSGTIRGSFTADAGAGTYTITGSEGSAKVSLGILHRTVDMGEVAQLLSPDGTGTLSCSGDDATLTSSASTLTLHRG